MGYKRAREEKRRLERLYVAAGNNYGSGIWYDPKKCRFRRYWLGAKSGYRKLLKRRSNRVVRRQKATLQYGAYRKAFDYWWELY